MCFPINCSMQVEGADRWVQCDRCQVKGGFGEEAAAAAVSVAVQAPDRTPIGTGKRPSWPPLAFACKHLPAHLTRATCAHSSFSPTTSNVRQPQVWRMVPADNWPAVQDDPREEWYCEYAAGLWDVSQQPPHKPACSPGGGSGGGPGSGRRGRR